MKKNKWRIALAVLVLGALGVFFYLNQPARYSFRSGQLSSDQS